MTDNKYFYSTSHLTGWVSDFTPPPFFGKLVYSDLSVEDSAFV
jgi:hypothetical protein